MAKISSYLRGVIKITLQRYDENPNGTILKNVCFTVGICRVPNEMRLARIGYFLLTQLPSSPYPRSIRATSLLRLKDYSCAYFLENILHFVNDIGGLGFFEFFS